MAMIGVVMAMMLHAANVAPESYAEVTRGDAMLFPRDFGSHPAFRTEWWYVTGSLADGAGAPLGFQITFFRVRTGNQIDNPSAFAARGLLIAHVAISDPARGRLWTDQRIRRVGAGLADAATEDTNVRIDDWRLQRSGDGYDALVQAEGFALQLRLQVTQPPLLNGDAGYSQKGPAARSASRYYSQPHLQVRGTMTRDARRDDVKGEAWLDHEWSSQYLDAEAVGWDWVGINLQDGGALTAFQIRDGAGGQHWAGATYRSADGAMQSFAPAQIDFRPLRRWRSSRTNVDYPISWRVRVGTREWELQPLMDDQENDTRLTSGALYWEGAVRAIENGKAVGNGYLELTGYDRPLKLTVP
jgi:predicted secreted hydrolase